MGWQCKLFSLTVFAAHHLVNQCDPPSHLSVVVSPAHTVGSQCKLFSLTVFAAHHLVNQCGPSPSHLSAVVSPAHTVRSQCKLFSLTVFAAHHLVNQCGPSPSHLSAVVSPAHTVGSQSQCLLPITWWNSVVLHPLTFLLFCHLHTLWAANVNCSVYQCFLPITWWTSVVVLPLTFHKPKTKKSVYLSFGNFYVKSADCRWYKCLSYRESVFLLQVPTYLLNFFFFVHMNNMELFTGNRSC